MLVNAHGCVKWDSHLAYISSVSVELINLSIELAIAHGGGKLQRQLKV